MLFLRAGRENAAGDRSGFCLHLSLVIERGYVPQVVRRGVEDAGQPGGWCMLPDERALHLGDAVQVLNGFTHAGAFSSLGHAARAA